jgi:hypothetical protein
VADDLGAAVLFIEVDDSKARKSIDALRQAVENFKPEFKGVERALTNIASQADKAKVQVQTLNQTLNQAPGASYSKISAQIGRLIAQSRELKIQSEQYIQTLQRIRELEFVRSARAGRQRVIADFEAVRGPTLQRGFGAPDRLPALPPTLAADAQRLKELNFTLNNLTKGSADYAATLKQIRQIENDVARATDSTTEAFKRRQRALEETRTASAQSRESGFAAFSAGVESGTATRGSIERNREKRELEAVRSVNSDILEIDLQRLRVVRQLSQQLGRASAAREASLTSGFGAFSASIGSPDPTQKAIRRASERRAQQEDRRTAQLDALDADLARVRESRLAAERRALDAERQQETISRRIAKEQQNAERQRLEASKRRREILGNAVIGGAFPLLFGQGIGASLGGGLGGAAGGAIGGQFGFGLSLAGTAVGAQLDAGIQRLGALGKALDDPIKQFSTLQQNASLSSKELERYVEGLIAVGRSAEAAATIQQDLIETFGSLQAAQAYNSQIDELNRAWSRATTVLASFVVGPLADFLSSLTSTGTRIGTAARFEQLVQSLSPEQYFQVRDRTTAATLQAREVRAAAQGGAAGLLTRFLPPSEGDVTAGRREGIKLAEQLLGVEQQRADAAARVAAAQVQTVAAFSDQFRLVDAQTQGYERQALIQEKQAVLNERNRKLLELPENRRTGSPEALQIQQDAALGVYRINQQIAQLDKDRLATSTLQIAQFRLQSTELERQFQQAKRIAAVPIREGVSIARENAQFRAGLGEQVRQAQANEARIAAEIEAEQLRGGDGSAERIRQLQLDQVNAARETRNIIGDAANQLRDAGIQLAENLRNSIVNLGQVRQDPGGLRQFLSPQANAARDQQTFRSLLPIFTQVRDRVARETGERIDFTGPTADVNERIIKFIQAAQADFTAQEQVIQTQTALAATNEALTTATAGLSTAINSLAQKSWNVAVNVSGASGAQVIGDVVGATA